MNLLSKFLNIDKKTKSTLWSSDLLSNEGLKLFYYSKEAIHSYCIADSVQQRRTIALQVAEILCLFLSYQFTEEELSFINSLLSNNTKILNKTKKQNISVMNRLKLLDSNGFYLLEIEDKIDLSILKSLYRKAAKKHHPDIGGSVKTMQLINEAYTIFHEALSNYFPLGELSENNGYISSTPENWEEFLFSIHLILACLYGDLFAADKSYEHLIKAYNFAFQSDSYYIGQFVSNLLGFGCVLDRTCRILGRFNMKNELEKAAQITSYFFDRYINDWAPNFEDDYKPSRNEYPDENSFISEIGVKIVISHPDQAKNAYRLGKIDNQRYLKTMKKFDSRLLINNEVIKKINEFINEIGFITKISNTNYTTKTIHSKVIISPSFDQDRFDFLEDNQKWEYLNTFSNKNTAINFNKYYIIRTQEILLGLINNYENIELNILKKEVTFFLNNFSDMFKRYVLLDEFLIYLQGLRSNMRGKILQLLCEIDDPNPISYSMSIIISMEGSFLNKSKNGYKKRINLDNEYIEFAMMNYEEINHYRNTGEYYNEYKKAWNKDLSLLKELGNSEIGKNQEHVWLHTKNPTAEMIIESLEPYLNELIKIGCKLHRKNTGELQIGYSINRITTAFAKNGEWQKVIYWGDLFFQLPLNYRDRSTETEQTKIKKRIERAKAIIQKA